VRSTAPENPTRRAWLTDRDLAIRYGISRVTVWRWARTGRIPQPHRLGPNTSRWSAAEIAERDARFLVNNRTQAIG
jgi:predicted DNA-binding transcriptional regulator AlpA